MSPQRKLNSQLWAPVHLFFGVLALITLLGTSMAAPLTPGPKFTRLNKTDAVSKYRLPGKARYRTELTLA